MTTDFTGNGLNKYPERYPTYESPRADADCFCVPYDQCPPHEVARKEDNTAGLIDPRNNRGAEIEALGPDEVVVTDGNGTMTIVKKNSVSIWPSDDQSHRRPNMNVFISLFSCVTGAEDQEEA